MPLTVMLTLVDVPVDQKNTNKYPATLQTAFTTVHTVIVVLTQDWK